jgi:sirohydrochlorin ferrochelatase
MTRVASELARQVCAARPGLRARAAFLRHEVPDLRAALAKEAALAHSAVIVVPLLLGDGHYARLVLPGAIRGAQPRDLPLAVKLAPVLGHAPGSDPDRHALGLLVDALRGRLAEALVTAQSDGRGTRADAIVLIGAGSRATRALQNAALVAAALGAAEGVPCRFAHTSTGPSGIRDAFMELRRRGAQQLVAASYHLGPGIQHDGMAAAALGWGAMAVTAPLGPAPELVSLILHRADAASIVHTG